ncbi:exosortase A [Photobacterium lutimaris]|nr:exosortase A [Photobacterium lutimaris]TDR78635.1 exosortase A [Photobacterium lutimaris]
MGKNKTVLFILPIVSWGLLYNQAFLDMISIWSTSKTYEHGFFIIPICLWVAWLQRRQFFAQPHDIAWWPIFLLPLPNLLWLVGYAADLALFEHIAAITSLQLMLWALLGTPRARVMWFPICYLIYCVPFGEQLIAPLQEITAELAITFLGLMNIPAYHEGLSITIPNGHFYVAEACSGIRFLISSLAIGCLFAYFQFTKVWKRIAFMGFSFIFPIIANGIRATGIILIGYFTDMAHATGADHLVYGWVFFSIVIVCIFLVANRFADPLPDSANPSATSQPISAPPIKAVGLVSALLLSFALWGKSISLSEQVILATTPMLSDSQPTDHSTWGITFPHASRSQSAVNRETDTYFYTARYSLWQNKGELISSENTLFDKDVWSVGQSIPLELDTQTQANSLSLTSKTGKKIQLVYWYCVNRFCSHDPITIKLFQAGLLITGGQGHADVFAITSHDPNIAKQQARRWLLESNTNP